MSDTDQIVLDEAKESAFILDKAYRRAIRNGDIDAVMELKPKVEEAYNEYSSARLKLLEEGVITTDEDVKEMRLIRAEIDEAADTQQLIAAAMKLISKLKVFI